MTTLIAFLDDPRLTAFRLHPAHIALSAVLGTWLLTRYGDGRGDKFYLVFGLVVAFGTALDVLQAIAFRAKGMRP